MIFSNIRTDFNFIFGQFSVAIKLILNGGVIRPTGLLFIYNLGLLYINNPSAVISRQTWQKPRLFLKYILGHVG